MRVTRRRLEQGLRDRGDIFGEDVMAAALIDRLVHHCHLATIRGNGCRMRQHTDLWRALQAPQEADAPAARPSGVATT